ncbi:TIGR03086 family metal-binding protein [Smaragdicoccus niigatensis]
MADWLELCKTALAGFGERVREVKDWQAPTPDTEWDVAHLVRHVIGEQQWVAPLVNGRTVAEATKDIDPLGDDLPAEWDRFSAQALKAWENASPEGTVALSYGLVPIEHYLREMVCDAAVHTWDLARAIGADETLDPTLVQEVLAEIEPKKDMLKASGLFADPVPVPDDASPQDRLLAMTGRDPR